MITGIAHVNLIVPPGTLDLAEAFYGETLGMHRAAVPVRQKDTLAWFNITPPTTTTTTDNNNGGQQHQHQHQQQVHIACGAADEVESSRHPCFRVESAEALAALQQRVWEHHLRRDASAPRMADRPGAENSGSKGVEYPTRFFARDYAGNRLEFSL